MFLSFCTNTVGWSLLADTLPRRAFPWGDEFAPDNTNAENRVGATGKPECRVVRGGSWHYPRVYARSFGLAPEV